MAKSELVYEFQGSRNLNTNPLDIAVQGDTYDYTLTAFFENEGISSTLNMTFNNDTTANYRRYKMEGDGTSVNGTVSEVITNVTLAANAYTYSGLCTASITGSSGDERYIDHLSTLSASSGDTRIRKNSSYWKNTANEITSIQLTKSVSVTSTCHILLYRTLKTASQGNWERVDELTWAAETAEKSFTVDGDRDKKYRVVWSGDNFLNIEINNDAGLNYIRQRLINSTGTINAQSTTVDSLESNGHEAEFIINAETGTKRLCTVSGAKTSAFQQAEFAFWYTDTATNITSLACTASSATGTATLYRMKSGTETSGTLNWELIEEVDVSGDFSAGHTFSGLTGDSEKLYRLEFLGNNGTSGALRVRFNNDSTSNQVSQYLRGNSGVVSAAASTTNGYQAFMGNTANTQGFADMLIYPKSGSQRASLISDYIQEDIISFKSSWWPNTASELTSIFVYNESTNTTTGKLKLWRLK